MLHCTVALDRVSETCPRKLVCLPFLFLNRCGRSLKHFSLADELDFAVTNGVRDCFHHAKAAERETATGLPFFLRNAQENVVSQMSEKKGFTSACRFFSDVFCTYVFINSFLTV